MKTICIWKVHFETFHWHERKKSFKWRSFNRKIISYKRNFYFVYSYDYENDFLMTEMSESVVGEHTVCFTITDSLFNEDVEVSMLSKLIILYSNHDSLFCVINYCLSSRINTFLTHFHIKAIILMRNANFCTFGSSFGKIKERTTFLYV